MKIELKTVSIIVFTSCMCPIVSGASGFDNLPIGSMDMLFDPAKASIEFGYTFIDRNVDYRAENTRSIAVENPGTVDETVGPPFPIDFGGPTSARATPNVWNYTVNAKVALTNSIDCLGRMNNPGTIEEVLPEPDQFCELTCKPSG